ncbi:MAG: lysophospholipid acyltransferase family protein [Candidatus Nealsonbacteria bacterium]
MRYIISKILYNFSWLILRPVFRFFINLEIESQENLKELQGPLIIAANHASWIDSFVIGASMPFLSKVFPIRFACWYKYYYSFRIFPIVWAFGCFPIKKGEELGKILKIPVNILKKRGVIGIFPEGKRRKAGRLRRGRKGAAYLSLKTNTKILPVKIEGNIKITFSNFLLRKHRVKVKIGKTFLLAPHDINDLNKLNTSAIFVMNKIREL